MTFVVYRPDALIVALAEVYAEHAQRWQTPLLRTIEDFVISVTTSGKRASTLVDMGTSTLRHLRWLEDVAPVTDLGDFPDLDVDARFWAAIDLMDGLLYDS